jgi:two-component system sensor histidine kinase/response regulator
MRPALEGLPILIADDHEGARHSLSDMLERMHFRVTAVESGAAAVSAIAAAAERGSPYRIALLDWKMPNENGIEAARRIKGLNLTQPPAIGIVTAYGREDVLHQADEAKIGTVLMKPVSASLLLDTVMRMMGERDGSPKISSHQPPKLEFSDAYILLAEDNPMNQQLAMELLTEVGIRVDVADNGQRAIDMALETGYDLILMDMQMPELDGIEATQRLRTLPQFADLPIIAMTANVMAQDRERCMNAGMNDFIAKPFRPDELYATLQRWLKPPPMVPEKPSIPLGSATTQLEPALPDTIQGLDLKRGVLMAGRPSRYARLLERFVEGQADTAHRIGQLLLDSKQQDAERLAHTLKGIAGQIAADELAKRATELELAIKTQQPESHLKAQIDEISQYLDNLCKAIRTGLDS